MGIENLEPYRHDLEQDLHEGFDDQPFVPEYERPRSTKEELHGNFEGDWTILLRDRFLHPKTEEKYFRLKRLFPTSEKRIESVQRDNGNSVDSSINLFKYTDIPPDEYEKMLSEEEYLENIKKVFNSTRYNNAEEDIKSEDNLGSSQGRGDEGVVFIDGKKEGRSLTNRQKNIIEAHEKAHGLMMGLTKGEKAYILKPFEEQRFKGKNKILEYSSKAQADEILARMTQLKNYFGFKGGEVFTRAHLSVARENYTHDTGLDNNMTEFFDAITDENEKEFLEMINNVAC